MTTLQMGAKRKRVCPAIVLLVGFLLIVLPAMNGHAQERHGRTAWSAWQYVRRFDPDGHQDDDQYFKGIQDDGRTVHVLRLPKLQGCPTTWAIVICGGGFLVTCFLSQSKRSVRVIKDRCRRVN